MRYRLQWGYCDGGGSAWWFLGVIIGGTIVLAGPVLADAMHRLLRVLFFFCIFSAPVFGVLITRFITRLQEAKKRKPRLRGPSYADYAYILY